MREEAVVGLFDRVERKLESAVNGAFARAFRAEVQPVEIASAMRRAMDDRAAVVGKGRTIVPNLFVIDLSPTDYERLTSYTELLADELVASVQEHAEQQRYVPGGPFHIDFRSREDLETGVFRVRPATAKRIPAAEPDERGAADRRRVEHAEELRRAHPFRTSEAEAPAQGAAGLASHAASAAAGSLASTAAAARAGRPPVPEPPVGAPSVSAPSVAEQPVDGPAAAPPAVAMMPAPDRVTGPDVPAGSAAPAEAPPYAAPDAPPYAAPAHAIPAEEPAQPAQLARPEPQPGVPPAAPMPLEDPADRPWLECDGDHYPLLGALTVLGRDPSADITLEDAGISRRHAEIRVTHDGPHFAITVRDLGSTNGTFVNGDRVTTSRVAEGDRLTMGRTSLLIRAGRR